MANVDRPSGLKPVQTLNGGNWDGRYSIYFVPSSDSTALFIGDAVAHAGGGDASGKYPTVAAATAGTGNAILGVIVGFGTQPQLMAQLPDLSARYRLASTDMYVAVVDDPNVIFEIQEVSAGTALTAAAIGNNAPLVAGTGNTTTGISGHELNNVGETALTEQLRILRVAPKEDNELGEHCKWWVRINENFYRQAAGV